MHISKIEKHPDKIGEEKKKSNSARINNKILWLKQTRRQTSMPKDISREQIKMRPLDRVK